MKHAVSVLCGALLLLLAGCATQPASADHDRARLKAIHAAAGDPVSSFSNTVTGLYSWEPLGNSELLIYTRPNRAWLLDLGICPDLPYTPAIGLTTHVGQVSARLDSVIVGRSRIPCRIQSIRPVDVKKLKETMDQRRGGNVVPADSDTAGDTSQ